MAGVTIAASEMTAAAPFLGSYVAMIVTPDPLDLAIASLAALRGVGRALPMIAGIAAGTAVLAGAALIAGDSLSSVLPAHLMDALAALAMFFLAGRIMLSNPFADSAVMPPLARHRLAAAGFLFSILDPVFATFLIAAFAGSLQPLVDRGDGWTIVLVVAFIDLGWLLVIASLMSHSHMRRMVRRWQVPVRLCSALVLAGLTIAKLIALFPLG